MEQTKFPVVLQREDKDCGPACLKMILDFWGINISLSDLCEKCGVNNKGTTLLQISQCANTLGFNTLSIRCSLEKLISHIVLPVIAYWHQNHFVVIYRTENKYIWVSDPAIGRMKYSIEKFLEEWYIKSEQYGVLLLLEPTRKI